MIRPIKIISDSTADLPKELIEKYDIEVLPLLVTLGENSYKDGIEICAQDIFKYYEDNKILPKTSAVSVAEYTDAFSRWVEKGYDVIHFCISSSMSACYQNACIAAVELGHVWSIDSANLSSGIGLQVLLAAELAAKGESAEVIAREVNEAKSRVDASFILNQLEFLHKGGRCSGVAALGANLLKLKPCIEVVEGKMKVGKKYRGAYEKCALEYVRDRLEGNDNIDTRRIFLTWTGLDEKLIKEIHKEIKKYHKFDEIIVNEAGSTITGHCGPGTFGVLYYRKENK
ncbi:MAG: DegV family protein [Oscillospiraceae bacterium]|nr:DegV family protein [Oscillospiraceae bacterium]MBQ2861816.1 DegV family protein [Oscillospiraceae bacterium]MBQ2997676.1 DegV family protein [Oscillospiraceae bacterium]MBQ3561666.1 DegV family protein [Oscillospiraceae bacterium]MBQ6699230.1 DegV family protein [Oscillospiraceae bacterium]